MPFDLPVPQPFNQHWKVKIRDKEALYEEPHVTVFFNGKQWRYGLRSRGFLDRSPNPSDVPGEVLNAINAAYDELCSGWDLRFPQNPVRGHEEEEG